MVFLTATSKHHVKVKLFTVIPEKLSLKMISSFTYEQRNRYKTCRDILHTDLTESDENSLLWPCYGKRNGVLGNYYHDVVDMRNGTSKGKISLSSSCNRPGEITINSVSTDTHLRSCIRRRRTLRIDIIELASGKRLLACILHRYSKIFNLLTKVMPNDDFICVIVLKKQLKFVYLRRQYEYTSIVRYVPTNQRHHMSALSQHSQFIFIFFYCDRGQKLTNVRLFLINCVPNEIQPVEKDLHLFEENTFQLNYRSFPGSRYPVAVGERGDLRWITKHRHRRGSTIHLHLWWLSK